MTDARSHVHPALLIGLVAAQTSTASVSPARRALSAGTALIPGAVAHGLGHLALGETSTALELLAIEGASILLGGAGGAVLAASGASRTLVLPAALATIGGVGLFILSYLADLYGASFESPLGEAARTPELEIRFGALYAYDPTFDYRWFLTHQLAYWLGPIALEPKVQIALDDDNARLGISARYRIVEATRRGSRLDLRGGYIHHRYGSADFSTNTLEIELGGRFDLQTLAPTLSGAFVEGSTGVALELDRFGIGVTDGRALLLARFGFGLFLGNGGSELLVYYDHRHDDLAGGTKIPGLISGVFGHFGLSALWNFSPSLGVALDAQTGSAHVVGLSLVYREGAR